MVINENIKCLFIIIFEKKSILDSYIIINKMINNIRKIKVIINLFENYDKMK
jgi:hypothetical protein